MDSSIIIELALFVTFWSIPAIFIYKMIKRKKIKNTVNFNLKKLITYRVLAIILYVISFICSVQIFIVIMSMVGLKGDVMVAQFFTLTPSLLIFILLGAVRKKVLEYCNLNDRTSLLGIAINSIMIFVTLFIALLITNAALLWGID